MVRDLQAKVTEQEGTIRALQLELAGIHSPKAWPLVRLTGMIRQRIDRISPPPDKASHAADGGEHQIARADRADLRVGRTANR